MLAGRNGARGRDCTCTGDALDVVSLLLDYASGGRRATIGMLKVVRVAGIAPALSKV